jgi:hypothetical protein
MKNFMRKHFAAAAGTTLVAGAAGLCGCASLGEQFVEGPQTIDYAKVAAIDRVARARGVSVYWYRYPTKPVESGEAAGGPPAKP